MGFNIFGKKNEEQDVHTTAPMPEPTPVVPTVGLLNLKKN